MDNDFTIDMAEINNFIEDVASEMNVNADKYLIKVKPEFTGKAVRGTGYRKEVRKKVHFLET